TSAASPNCSSQMTPARQFLTCEAASGSFERISQPRPAPAANRKSTKTHHGQPPSSTMVPFEKTARGYLKRNSNISESFDANFRGREHREANEWRRLQPVEVCRSTVALAATNPHR